NKQKVYAQKAISILETEYATNGKNFEEILRMEKRLLSYSLELEKAYSDKQASIAFINYLMGE
ncbi:MAG: TolC family protein, partial [Bacteroidetes bacterium]